MFLSTIFLNIYEEDTCHKLNESYKVFSKVCENKENCCQHLASMNNLTLMDCYDNRNYYCETKEDINYEVFNITAIIILICSVISSIILIALIIYHKKRERDNYQEI